MSNQNKLKEIVRKIIKKEVEEAKNTFINFDLMEFTSLFSLAFESSGNRISKLAAKSWKIISKILLDQANTPKTDPE